MSAKWQPGDVALVETPGHGWKVSVAVGGANGPCWHSAYPDGDLRCLAAEAVDARPLVVIDPEDMEQVEALWMAYFREPNGMRVEALQTALRSLIADPEPEEPTGLGAVVEDGDGREYVRAYRDGTPWIDNAGRIYTWSQLVQKGVEVKGGGYEAES